MFLTSKYSGYNRAGEQSSAGLFLILATQKGSPLTLDYHGKIRAYVRFVRLIQMGHFMMGSTRIGPDKLTLSGAYGNDGLLCEVSPEAFQRGVPLPDALVDAWAHGGGHNTTGSEAEDMRRWALAHLAQLRGRPTLANSLTR